MRLLALACLLTLALDMRAHNRVERLGGVNIWGYRGPVMQQKAANEIRIATVGGDLAFGWGVAASETLVYGVRQLVALALDVRGGQLRRFTAVDLGAVGLEPAGYADWIRHFAYLRPDVICIVPDARGHRTAGVSIQPDRHSAIFREFGYAPILPLVLEEKGARLHSTPVTRDRLNGLGAVTHRRGGSRISRRRPARLVLRRRDQECRAGGARQWFSGRGRRAAECGVRGVLPMVTRSRRW